MKFLKFSINADGSDKYIIPIDQIVGCFPHVYITDRGTNIHVKLSDDVQIRLLHSEDRDVSFNIMERIADGSSYNVIDVSDLLPTIITNGDGTKCEMINT